MSATIPTMTGAALTQADHAAALLTSWHDYPADALPLIPEGFEHSWSATYPVFVNDALRLGLIIEYPNPAQREDPEEPRFFLFANPEDPGDLPTDILATDNWNAVLAHIDARRTV